MLRQIEIESNWLSHINKYDSIFDSVENVDPSVTYNEFFSKYLIKNKPCIINSQATKDWPCRERWVQDNAPNFDTLNKLYGKCMVPIADCNKRYYNSQFKDDMEMKDYLDYWIEYKKSNYAHSRPLLYLKDWHCIKKFPDVAIYETPQYFASDWLNEYYLAHPELSDDYMFVYMGPKGTWTPLHADVFTSYSWSANITGKKQWLLFPPHEEDYLRDTYGQLVYDALSEELSDRSKYQMYDSQKLKSFNITQEPGEIIFVPSGWYHQVWNMEDTISINHNWINGCNIMNVWQSLKKELHSVMREIEDCKDMTNWVEHCQLMLKASYGMDYIQFYDFISFIANKRLNTILNQTRTISFQRYELGMNHCLFDLKAIKIILEDFIADAKKHSVYTLVCECDRACTLLSKIISFL